MLAPGALSAMKFNTSRLSSHWQPGGHARRHLDSPAAPPLAAHLHNTGQRAHQACSSRAHVRSLEARRHWCLQAPASSTATLADAAAVMLAVRMRDACGRVRMQLLLQHITFPSYAACVAAGRAPHLHRQCNSQTTGSTRGVLIPPVRHTLPPATWTGLLACCPRLGCNALYRDETADVYFQWRGDHAPVDENHLPSSNCLPPARFILTSLAPIVAFRVEVFLEFQAVHRTPSSRRGRCAAQHAPACSAPPSCVLCSTTHYTDECW